MKGKWLIAVLVAVAGGCGTCGLGALVLLAAGDESPAQSASGEYPPELIAFWSGGSDKLLLYPDGRAKKHLRQSWQGGTAVVVCKVNADLEGTWSVNGDQLTLRFTEGRWQTCEGEQDFEPITEQVTWRIASTPNSYSPYGITLWMKAPGRDEGGLNKMCLDPDDCEKFQVAPF